MDPQGTGGGLPAKGKIVVPLSEAERVEERLEKVRTHQAGQNGRRPPGASGAAGEGGAREEQQPVEFVHIKTPGRNYAVLQVGDFDSNAATFPPGNMYVAVIWGVGKVYIRIHVLLRTNANF